MYKRERGKKLVLAFVQIYVWIKSLGCGKLFIAQIRQITLNDIHGWTWQKILKSITFGQKFFRNLSLNFLTHPRWCHFENISNIHFWSTFENLFRDFIFSSVKTIFLQCHLKNFSIFVHFAFYFRKKNYPGLCHKKTDYGRSTLFLAYHFLIFPFVKKFRKKLDKN